MQFLANLQVFCSKTSVIFKNTLIDTAPIVSSGTDGTFGPYLPEYLQKTHKNKSSLHTYLYLACSGNEPRQFRTGMAGMTKTVIGLFRWEQSGPRFIFIANDFVLNKNFALMASEPGIP